MKSFSAIALLCVLFALDVRGLGAAEPANGCITTGNGYLRGRMRGALNLDVGWENAQLECDGGPRPDGSGLRLSFAGPPSIDGRRLRMVFGISGAVEGKSGRGLPTNLTVIFEGEQRVFATRGEGKCSIDDLRQERIGGLGAGTRRYRVIARGFCTSPATAFDRDERILLSSFDLAGTATFGDGEENAAPLSSFPRTSLQIISGETTHRFDVWVADNPERQTQGLMFVRELDPAHGMLFPQSPPRVAGFWMKNTLIELDMVFIGTDGRIARIAERTQPLSLDTISSRVPVKAVLELRGGEAAKRKLKPGDRVAWPQDR